MVVILILVCWIAFSFWYQKRNAYIEKHKRKMKNDTDYEMYLDWCEKHVKTPMDKEVFIKEIEENEKHINSIK